MLDALGQFGLRLGGHAWWFLTMVILVRKPMFDRLPLGIKDAIRGYGVSQRFLEWTPRSWMANSFAVSGIVVASFLAFQDEFDALNIALDERAQVRAELDIAKQQLAAIAPSGQGQKVADLTAKLERVRANEWAPFSSDEKANLVAALKLLTPHSIVIVCETVNCEVLSAELVAAFADAGWPASKLHGGGLGIAGTNGISLNPNDDGTKYLKEAIEETTSLKIDLGPDRREDWGTNPPYLVVGAKPF
jgi:hypothetical protein